MSGNEVRMDLNSNISDTTVPTTTVTVTLSATVKVDWHQLLWIPYVLLTVILSALAIASFVHYHFTNRGKYRSAVIKRQENDHIRTRKYRVTLNRKGLVGCLGSGYRSSVSTNESSDDADYETPRRIANGYNESIFIVTNEFSKQTKLDRSDNDKNATLSHNSIHSDSRDKYSSFENDGYDLDSSQGSEKSLIRKQKATGKETNKNSNKRKTESLRTDKSTTSQTSRTEGSVMWEASRDYVYRISEENVRSECATPQHEQAVAFRSETPLDLPDNSTNELNTKPSTVRDQLRRTGPGMQTQQITVLPQVEKYDNEALSEEEGSIFDIEEEEEADVI